MIVKGKAQGGASKLAKHLCRTDQNERVRVVTIGGLAAKTIPDALRDLDELGAAADTKRTLYHGILAPKVGEDLTAEQRREAVRQMADKMGLAGQPYIVVGHVKTGEPEHFHVIWSRIDQERQAGISDSHNYRKHEELSQALNRAFGFDQVKGVHLRDKAVEARPERTPAHWEQQQAQRTGQDIDAVRDQVTEAWRATRTGAELVDALAQAGFQVARGSRRDFVVVDQAGGVHSMARRIEGARAKDVRERMTDIRVDELADVQQARQRQKALRDTAAAELGEKVGHKVISAAERMRLEELAAERDAKGSTRPKLDHNDRDISAAVRMLEQLGTVTNVVGRPVAVHRAEPRNEPIPGGTRVAGTSSEPIQRPSVEVENRNRVPNQAQPGQFMRWDPVTEWTPVQIEKRPQQGQEAAPAAPAPPRRVSFLDRLQAQREARGEQLRDVLERQQQQEKGLGLDLEL